MDRYGTRLNILYIPSRHIHKYQTMYYEAKQMRYTNIKTTQ